MDEEQEEINQRESFTKQQMKKGKDKLKEEGKKQAKQKIVQFLAANPEVVAVLAIVLVVVILLVVLLCGALYVVDKWKESNVNTSKQKAITMSYSSGNTSTMETDDYGNSINKIVIQPNSNKSGYEISYNDDPENLENIKEKLEAQTSRSATEFSDFELAILGALMDNGADLDYYTTEQLHCFPAFIKAEACTRYLDLRPNSEKFKDGEYVPELIDDLDENEVPGVILVQRTNTENNEPVTLEYMIEDEFNKLVENNDEKAIDYFTVNDKGNLVISKWEYTYITVEGEYPENIDESEKQQPEDAYNITTEEFAYIQKIKKDYTMPFEFLVQLLVITEEPDFCNELVEYVLGSKIIINIQEEETFTVTDQVNEYTIHNKDEKRINYNVTVAEEIVASENNHFLNYSQDDEENECTNYENSETQVKIHTEITSHSYVLEISELDTWLAHYIKTYQKQSATTEESGPTSTDIKGEYKKLEETNITDQSEITEDKDVKTFISKNETEYEEQIPDPINITITSGTDVNGNNYKQIHYINNGIVEEISGLTNGATVYYEVKDSEGNGTGEYNLPGSLALKMKEVPETENTARIPPISYIYALIGNEYVVQNSGNGDAKIEVTKLNVKDFEKIDLIATTTTTTTEYPADPNPTTNIHIYATESGTPGKGHGDENTVYEKFLVAYDNSAGARNQINSISYWLYEMMEDNDNTKDMIDTVKYLLYMYDGKNRGVPELEGFEDIFTPDEFILSTGGSIVVKTDVTGALQELTKEEVEEVIKKRYSGQAKDNLLSSLDAFMYIQETYHVNAIFAIAVTQKECSCGTNLQIGGYNWYSILGSSSWKQYSSYDEATRDFGNLIANSSYYFKAGNYTVDSIGNVYCVPPEGWIKDVSQYVKEMYESIGITVISGGGNEIQQKVVEVAKNSSQYGISAISGYCQAWVSDVYLKAGANTTRASACCAVHAGAIWGVSTDWSQIQVGAAVYGYASQTYGHVGIYVGDGMVAHNRGGVKYDSLEDWIKGYKGICWGWNGGTDLTGGSYPCKTGLMTAGH